MPDDAGHGHGARAPGAAKVEVEYVVLDIWVATDVILRGFSIITTILHAECLQPGWSEQLTIRMEPPDRWVATALAMAGFSATHRIFGMAIDDSSQWHRFSCRPWCLSSVCPSRHYYCRAKREKRVARGIDACRNAPTNRSRRPDYISFCLRPRFFTARRSGARACSVQSMEEKMENGIARWLLRGWRLPGRWLGLMDRPDGDDGNTRHAA